MGGGGGGVDLFQCKNKLKQEKMTTALEFSIGTKSTYMCDLYLIAKETEIV